MESEHAEGTRFKIDRHASHISFPSSENQLPMLVMYRPFSLGGRPLSLSLTRSLSLCLFLHPFSDCFFRLPLKEVPVPYRILHGMKRTSRHGATSALTLLTPRPVVVRSQLTRSVCVSTISRWSSTPSSKLFPASSTCCWSV